MAKSDKHLSYDELFLENASLRTEITRLKQQLNELESRETIAPPLIHKATLEDPPYSHIHKLSSPDDKIELFMQLFAGRTDVYAQRFVNKRNEKSGYTPVCANQWVDGLCQKPKVKCSKCVNRKLLPLTKSVIYSHLSGKNQLGEDVIGVYPMLPDETCRFLVVDFDGDNWQDDVQAFRDKCKQHNLQVVVERSRSGNGGHIWLLFEEAVNCALARRLASGLLTAAMEQRHALSFHSYDRFIPNQDTMPTGGFGNLVALPLQGLARNCGNSEFVDEHFVAYPDQWAYLATLRKIPTAVVEALARELGGNGDLGILAEAEPTNRPWEKQPVVTLGSSDFPASIKLVRANGIYVPKYGCSERALGLIKRLAAFKNPDFYKAQAMRLPTYKKPRVICCAWETDDYICVPRGLEADALSLIRDAGTSIVIENQTETGRAINVKFLGELRTDQVTAAHALLAHDNGVLSATTAFGKTVVAAYMIGQHKVNTLILVHTHTLMNQWVKSLEQFLYINETLPEQPKGRGRKKALSVIGRLGGGKNQLSNIIDIAIIGSLIDSNDAKLLVKDYGMVIVDECHHVPAMRFETVLRQVTAQYVYGLSATPIRQDGHHPIIFQQCGPIRYSVDAKQQSLSRGFDHTLIPRFTNFRKPFTAPENWSVTDVYRALAENNVRNNMIIHDVSVAIKQGCTPLILTERVEHAKVLTKILREEFSDMHIFLLSGQGTTKTKQVILDHLRDLPANTPLAIVATGKYVGEGFDGPRLDTLFVTMPIAWKGTVSQYAGRLHRIYENKKEVRVYDYVDIHVPVLERMYYKRMNAYSSLGYSVQTLSTESGQKIGAIFNQQSFFPVFTNDVEHAKKEALIVSPYLSKTRVRQMKRLLMAAMGHGVNVVIVTRPPESFSETARRNVFSMIAELQDVGIDVLLRKPIHQKFAVIDRQIVWYGSINLLSYGRSEESMMRFEHRDIAEELLMDIEMR